MASSRGPGRGVASRAGSRHPRAGSPGSQPRNKQGAGSAGSRPTPHPGRRPGRGGVTATPRRQTPPHLWRLGFLVVLLGFLAVFLMPTLRGYLDQRAEITRTQQQIEQERTEIARLEEAVAQYDDDDFVERQARERLRFVRPGEVAISVLDDTGGQLTEPVPGMAAVTDEVREARPWYGEVWESVLIANKGLPETEVPADRTTDGKTKGSTDGNGGR